MTEAWDSMMEKQRAAGPGILQMVCGMTGVAAFFGDLAADGRDRERGFSLLSPSPGLFLVLDVSRGMA